MFSITRDSHKKNYTCISNELLRDKRLSLEAKGFMAVVLSLPDDWEFSVRGMASLCATTTTVLYRIMAELDRKGYLRRIREKGDDGRFLEFKYTFFETPLSPSEEPHDEEPFPENPYMEEPLPENPYMEEPLSGIQPQSNTNISSIQDLLNTVFFNRSDQSDEKEEFNEVDKDGFTEESEDGIIDVEYREVKTDGRNKQNEIEENNHTAQEEKKDEPRYSPDKVNLQINAQRLALVYDRTTVNRIAYLIMECINGGARTINGESIPAQRVREVFMQIRGEDVGNAIKSVGKREIKSFNAYYTTTLYNTVIKRLERTKPQREQQSSLDLDEIRESVLRKYRQLAEEENLSSLNIQKI